MENGAIRLIFVSVHFCIYICVVSVFVRARVVECDPAVEAVGARKRRYARQSRRLPHLPEQDWAGPRDVTVRWRHKTEPEMYEFVCRTADERRVWIQTLRDAIISCSQEGSTSLVVLCVLSPKLHSHPSDFCHEFLVRRDLQEVYNKSASPQRI